MEPYSAEDREAALASLSRYAHQLAHVYAPAWLYDDARQSAMIGAILFLAK